MDFIIIEDISDISGKSVSAVNGWGLPTRKGPCGQMITGRAILNYFDGSNVESNDNIKVKNKLKALGI